MTCVMFVCQNGSPGPGSYDCFSSYEVNSPSFSKKGTTGFVPPKVRTPIGCHLKAPLGS